MCSPRPRHVISSFPSASRWFLGSGPTCHSTIFFDLLPIYLLIATTLLVTVIYLRYLLKTGREGPELKLFVCVSAAKSLFSAFSRSFSLRSRCPRLSAGHTFVKMDGCPHA
jgi:hypothetical protein